MTPRKKTAAATTPRQSVRSAASNAKDSAASDTGATEEETISTTIDTDNNDASQQTGATKEPVAETLEEQSPKQQQPHLTAEVDEHLYDEDDLLPPNKEEIEEKPKEVTDEIKETTDSFAQDDRPKPRTSRSRSPSPVAGRRYSRRRSPSISESSRSLSRSLSRSPSYTPSPSPRRRGNRRYSSKSPSPSSSRSPYKRRRSRSPSPYHKRRRSSRSPPSQHYDYPPPQHHGRRSNAPYFGTADERARSTTIYVENLPFNFTDDHMYSLFGRFGPVRKISMPFSHYMGRIKGFAFVEFEHRRDAEDAFNHFDGKNVEGRWLRCDWDVAKIRRDTGTVMAPPPPAYNDYYQGYSSGVPGAYSGYPQYYPGYGYPGYYPPHPQQGGPGNQNGYY